MTKENTKYFETNFIKDPSAFIEDTGLLFEINRHILHPFGLSLGIVKEGDKSEGVGKFMITSAKGDKEGIVYSEESFSEGLRKISSFLESEGVQKMNNRREELGYVIQEIPDPHYKKNGVELFTYNPDYDDSDPNSSNTIIFKVPYNWLEKEVRDWYDRSVQDFLLHYTHDDSELILRYALEEGVVLEIKEVAILK